MRIDKLHPQNGRFLDDADRERNIIERVTGAFTGINSDHAAIHEGEGFTPVVTDTGASYVTVAGGIGAIRTIFFRTPADKYVHLKDYKFMSNGEDVAVMFYRGVYLPYDYEGTIEVTQAPASDGNITINLNGTDRVVAVLDTDNEAGVATKIAAILDGVGGIDATAVGAVVTVTYTAANEWEPMVIEFEDTDETGVLVDIDVVETLNAAASEIEIFNRNHVSTTESEMNMYLADNTIAIADFATAANAELRERIWMYGEGPTGQGSNAQGPAGSGVDLNIEHVLTPNTNYAMVIENGTADAFSILPWLFWYEESEG